MGLVTESEVRPVNTRPDGWGVSLLCRVTNEGGPYLFALLTFYGFYGCCVEVFELLWGGRNAMFDWVYTLPFLLSPFFLFLLPCLCFLPSFLLACFLLCKPQGNTWKKTHSYGSLLQKAWKDDPLRSRGHFCPVDGEHWVPAVRDKTMKRCEGKIQRVVMALWHCQAWENCVNNWPQMEWRAGSWGSG